MTKVTCTDLMTKMTSTDLMTKMTSTDMMTKVTISKTILLVKNDNACMKIEHISSSFNDNKVVKLRCILCH